MSLFLDQSASFYAVAAFAVFFVAIAKAGFGGIIGSVAMPLVAAASDTVTAVAVLYPAYLLIDLVVVWTYRRSIPWPVLRPMLAAGALGTLAATLAYGTFAPEAFAVVLGTMAVAAAIRFTLRPPGRTGEAAPAPGPARRGLLPLIGWCGLAGFFSFFLMGAVPAQIYLLPLRLDPRVHVAATVAFFAAMNWSRVPIVLELGIVTPQTLLTTALLLPVLPAGILAGRWIVAHLRKEPFFLIAQALLFLLGLYLIAGAAAHYLRPGAAD
jgi:uncharacterized membrane protein YfcA